MSRSDCGAVGHYCPEWDFAWVRPEDPESECCICGMGTPNGIPGGSMKRIDDGMSIATFAVLLLCFAVGLFCAWVIL